MSQIKLDWIGLDWIGLDWMWCTQSKMAVLVNELAKNLYEKNIIM